MIYYEEATVKKYKRKNNKDSTQINLGVNSKFTKGAKVIVINEDDFKKLTSNNNVDLKKELDDVRAKFEETSSQNKEVDELKNLLLKEKEEKEKLLITITTHERAINDKELLIAAKDNTISNYENEITGYKDTIEYKDNTIAGYKKDIEDKDNTISNYENEIEDKENKISNYENDIETKDNTIETLTHNWAWYKRIFNILPAGVKLNDNDKDE